MTDQAELQEALAKLPPRAQVIACQTIDLAWELHDAPDFWLDWALNTLAKAAEGGDWARPWEAAMEEWE